ncbi:MAG: hypothetical protein CSB13_07180 [Chloroflexi bacterium]|nr:MAG: hypothetical protein CSB13_07180 [Chloroflexota bacterium]
MTNHQAKVWLVFISLGLAALLFTACSTETSTNNATAESAPPTAETLTENRAADTIEQGEVLSDVSDIFEEAAESSQPNHDNEEIALVNTAYDGNVPVGFTETGNPYRGNPNAPVVIEEFSDFQ